MKRTLYKVEMKFAYGWDDAGWMTDDGTTECPTRFVTRRAAQAEINEHCEMMAEAVKAGDMTDADKPSDFRIVEATD